LFQTLCFEMYTLILNRHTVRAEGGCVPSTGRLAWKLDHRIALDLWIAQGASNRQHG
jgi:hypothetical protein